LYLTTPGTPLALVVRIFLPPPFGVLIPATKVIGILLGPAPLCSRLAFSRAGFSTTALLSLPYTPIRTEIPPAKLTLLAQLLLFVWDMTIYLCSTISAQNKPNKRIKYLEQGEGN
jgi:hypothetical protein